jgi:hypothetical protein
MEKLHEFYGDGPWANRKAEVHYDSTNKEFTIKCMKHVWKTIEEKKVLGDHGEQIAETLAENYVLGTDQK